MPAPNDSLSIIDSTVHLGELVRTVRKEQGLTQLDVLGLLGLEVVIRRKS